MEGTSHALLQRTIPALVWREKVKPQKVPVKKPWPGSDCNRTPPQCKTKRYRYSKLNEIFVTKGWNGV